MTTYVPRHMWDCLWSSSSYKSKELERKGVRAAKTTKKVHEQVINLF